MNRLMIIGDSVIRGIYYSQEQKKYKFCPDNKYESLSSYGIEVDNEARMGATLKDCLARLKDGLCGNEQNTAVLLSFGGNDCNYNWKEISDNPTASHLPQTPIDEFINGYSECINYAKKRGAEVIMSNIVPIDALKFMNWISKGLSYDNIMNWLGDISVLYRWQEYYSRTLDNIAADFRCPLLDIRTSFLMSHEYDKLICEDGMHPTIYGHSIIHNKITSFIPSLF